MSAHLPVLPSPVPLAEVRSESDHFRCTRYRAQLSARTCIERQLEVNRPRVRSVNVGRQPKEHPGCVGCPDGAQVRAQLAPKKGAKARVAPTTEPDAGLAEERERLAALPTHVDALREALRARGEVPTRVVRELLSGRRMPGPALFDAVEFLRARGEVRRVRRGVLALVRPEGGSR